MAALTLDEIAAIRASYDRIAEVELDLAQVFYATLFARNPELRALFSSDMLEQASKLAETLDTLVRHLDTLDAVMPQLQDLALRHTEYGVEAEHYWAVRSALLDTIASQIPGGTSPAELAAWSAALALISAAMIAHAYPVAA